MSSDPENEFFSDGITEEIIKALAQMTGSARTTTSSLFIIVAKDFKKTAQLPANANLTIMAIAYDCGFNSKTAFNTYFKKEAGTTPKQFLIR